MKLTKSMTGMKIQGNRYYVSINGGDKVVDGVVFADGRGVVVEKKVVSVELWVEVTKDELVAIVAEAKELGIVCDPSTSTPDTVVRRFDWSKAKTQEEIIAELKKDNDFLKSQNELLVYQLEEWEAMGVTPKARMDALDELRETMAADYAQRMKEQAAQHAEGVAELKQKLQLASDVLVDFVLVNLQETETGEVFF